jgi:hypothetical protein
MVFFGARFILYFQVKIIIIRGGDRKDPQWTVLLRPITSGHATICGLKNLKASLFQMPCWYNLPNKYNTYVFTSVATKCRLA